MTEPTLGPASFLGRRSAAPRGTPRGPRPYAHCGEDATAADVAFAALRALVHAEDPEAVRHVVATAVGDLGGAVVPARYEPQDALGVDIALGLADPAVVVVDPLSTAAMDLREVLPALLDDARAVLDRMQQAAEEVVARGTADAEPEDVHEYLRMLGTSDLDGARRFTRRLLDRGVAPAAVVEDVLAPAQREAGERWYRGEWSIADEHAATAVSEACLAVLPAVSSGPSVVLAAPEGEWHVLPSRLAAAAARGARARALGPGLPADHLQRFLVARKPDLLALSVTMSTNLIAAARSVAAAHAAGIPVLLGGRALGSDQSRALALGADGWSRSATTLGSVVPRPRAASDPLPYEAVVADAVDDGVLLLALERQAAATTWVAALNATQQRHALDDLRWITRHAAAALACHDPTVLDDMLRWLDVQMQSRGVPAEVLPDSAGYLADALEAETPRVAELVHDAAARLR